MPKARIDQAFDQVRIQGDKAFVPYIMAGDGGLAKLDEQLAFLEQAGATVVELGIPFSDPVADGPTIQEAGIRALKEGVSLQKVLDKLAESKENRDIPIVLMTYINPIYTFGVAEFAKACEESGVDGLIIPDLPLEEESLVVESLRAHDIALIRLAALTSPQARLEEIAKRTEGFLYAVTVTGTTGARIDFSDHVGTYLAQLKEMSKAPVLAGFGVSTPEHVRSLSKHCDGVVVGSKIVDSLHAGDKQTIETLIAASKNSVNVR
ncbi:tryptophan synthase alpha chain [Natronobacillus azotifigens]|uniref:Tryptophan synthase alpha chain n=1 Tax=Natronobacillus azotifigens TaxID=472978 RepID=A0A9J6RB85_9BACI|nr:tryptophan synthase subunit alpha [Natronobacillus azotifigens]MCZ0702497.1 tryptophan synthase subunit alpha [Natronobacillus azotifigens]